MPNPLADLGIPAGGVPLLDRQPEGAMRIPLGMLGGGGKPEPVLFANSLAVMASPSEVVLIFLATMGTGDQEPPREVARIAVTWEFFAKMLAHMSGILDQVGDDRTEALNDALAEHEKLLAQLRASVDAPEPSS